MEFPSFTFNLEDPGMTIAFSMANSEENPKDIENLMDLEYEKVKNELISEKEFQKLRNQVLLKFYFVLIKTMNEKIIN